MKEHPIIFSTESVQAILEGRKTQTRRVIKPAKTSATAKYFDPKLDNWPIDQGTGRKLRCPYGQVGDRLWVKETWRIESFMEGEPLLFSYKDGQTTEENEYSDTPDYESWYERVCIQSTDEAKIAFEKGLVRQDEDNGYYRWDIGKSPCRWRSPRFMPRWASRITLEITGVRVERLQEISPSDCKKEGLLYPDQGSQKDFVMAYIGGFMELWDSLNAKRGYGWETNCWVWVIEFKRLDE